MDFSCDEISIRLSLAKIAQTLGVDNELNVGSKSYRELLELAHDTDTGWSNLAALCAQAVDEMNSSVFF